jgi:hypothetical protein
VWHSPMRLEHRAKIKSNDPSASGSVSPSLAAPHLFVRGFRRGFLKFSALLPAHFRGSAPAFPARGFRRAVFRNRDSRCGSRRASGNTYVLSETWIFLGARISAFDMTMISREPDGRPRQHYTGSFIRLNIVCCCI